MRTTQLTRVSRKLLLTTLSVLLLWCCGSVALASDPVGVYAVVEKVVAEPSEGAPERVQVWGVFSLADRSSGDEYAKPVYGYMYYNAAEKPEAARREWADLKSVAGTGQAVAFGSRYKEKGRVRPATEKPEKPDGYPIEMGLTKVRRTEYGPVRAVLEVPVPVSPEPAAEVPAGKVTLSARARQSGDNEPAPKCVFEITATGGQKETSEPVDAGADGKATWSPRMQLKAGETYTWSVRKADAQGGAGSTSALKVGGAAEGAGAAKEAK